MDNNGTETGLDDLTQLEPAEETNDAMKPKGVESNNGDNDHNGVKTGAEGEDVQVQDPEMEEIRARMLEMEAEAQKLKEMQSEVEKQMNLSSPPQAATATSPFPSQEDKIESDSRSVYIGNVDYGATAEEIEAHFHGCGSVNRVTILCDRFTGHPKGFAYVEFSDKDSVMTAMALDESLFRGRQIKVSPKRTNRPGISTTNRGRGRGGRGRGRGGGYAPRARRGHFRGRGNFYSPY